MSALIVEVCEVLAVEKHPNADRLAIATVKGWKTCIQYDPETGEAQFKPGDKCIYFPPDSVMPVELSDRLGITKYLAPLPKGLDGKRPPRNRVRAARLRGVASFGVIMAVTDNPNWQVGDDVSEFYGITKWEPPEPSIDGDSERPHPRFHTYTEIENWRNFPNIFQEGEEVIITEKVHGKNCRNGYIGTTDKDGVTVWEFMSGSHGIRRKEIDAHGRKSDFWKVLTDELKALLKSVSQDEKNVVAFGEVYGSGVQDMTYGLEHGHHSYRLFDIAVDGKYMDYDDKVALCQRFGIEMVPILYRGPYSPQIVEELTDGPTTVCDPDKAGPFKGREGVVIAPIVERFSADIGGEGRVILKSISVDYLARKGGTDGH